MKYPKNRGVARLTRRRPSCLERLEARRVLSTSPFNLGDYVELPDTITIGQGSFTTVLPAGESRPSSTPNFTPDYEGPAAASEWWSSMAFGEGGPAFPVHSHPLATVDLPDGLLIGYPSTARAFGDSYSYSFESDLRLGLVGFAPGRPAVADHSDWNVTTRWESGADRLETTFGHGLPFVYANRMGERDAVIELRAASTVWSNSGGVAGVTIEGRHYGVFAPTGSAWDLSGDALTSDLNGADYFSVAVLPDASQATLDFFRARAFAFVTDSAVSWVYDEATAVVQSTYAVTTTPQETGGVNLDEPLTALYRHQWLNSDDPLTAHTYESSRGEMRLFAGHAFTTQMQHTGVLPVLPTLGADPTRLRGYLNEVLGPGDLIATTDTYFTGTNLYKLARLIPVAEQLGELETRERLLSEVRNELEDWFASDDGGQGQFYFDESWNSLIGYPDSFGSATSLNDHHFHYGYFIQSAAIVAMYDPEWASESEWGGMVELLIRDAANWERDDPTFQFLRSFDIYAGHAWASGDSEFGRGNNQESSSEAMNFSNGLILWGSITGDTEIRDLGIYLSTTHQAAIEQYWFDVDDAVFPEAYPHPAAGIVWSDGATYTTFFSGEPELIQGINYLPLAGGSLYLGRHPDYIQTAYDHIVQENGGPVDNWEDLMASYLALADAETALADFLANPVDDIQPRALTYQWITALDEMGRVDPTVTADTPHYAVFVEDGQRSYVAYNPGNTPIDVVFSDGTTVPVPAGATVTSGANTFLWAPDPDRQPTPPQDRLFLRDRQGTAPTATLAFTPGRRAETDVLPAPEGGVFFDEPNNPLVYRADAVNGVYDPSKTTDLRLYLDAMTNGGAAAQARVSYDFEGDGVPDRVETYNSFSTDGVVGWQAYSDNRGLASVSGGFRDFVDGTVTLEVWSVFGPGGVNVRTGASLGEGQQSFVNIPFGGVSQSDGIRLSLEEPSVSERNGTTQVTVTRSGPTTEPLLVSLSSDDPANALVIGPSSITLAAGEASGGFEVAGVNNFLPDGDREVTLTALAAGFDATTVRVTVVDDEPEPLTELELFVRDGAGPGVVGPLSPTPGGAAASDVVAQDSGAIGSPGTPTVYELTGLNGQFRPGGETRFDLYLDNGSNVGSATQARVSYDFDGDGSFDRVETYGFFPTDPVNGWELYQRDSSAAAVSGVSFAEMQGGRVRLELWKGFGPGDVTIRTDAPAGDPRQSTLVLPFTPAPRLAGDFNRDGAVDSADYTVYRDTLGLDVPGYYAADANGDGRIGPADRDLWIANYGATASSAPLTSSIVAPRTNTPPAVQATVAESVVTQQPTTPAAAVRSPARPSPGRRVASNPPAAVDLRGELLLLSRLGAPACVDDGPSNGPAPESPSDRSDEDASPREAAFALLLNDLPEPL